MRRMQCVLLCVFFLLFSLPALCETRALLVACSDFVTQPDLGSAISGNLHMIASVLLGASPSLSDLSIEDGTISSPHALESAVTQAFENASEADLSILYLCTHGVHSTDDQQVYLLLGDGENESLLSGEMLYRMLSGIQGDKLLILDACYSGALLGHDQPNVASDNHAALSAFASPFIADTGMHIITSASGSESSWYYDSEGLQNGAVSYFASALSSGLGLYGTVEADMNGDGLVSLAELHDHLCVSVSSSSSQLISSRPSDIFMPTARGPMLSRPLAGFSFSGSLLPAFDPTLDFSFTVTSETAVQYRLIEFENGNWNWENAQTFMDGDLPLPSGRHSRTLTLPTVTAEDSGYLMLQVFSVSDGELLLCAEKMIAITPSALQDVLTIDCPDVYAAPGIFELPISVSLGVPAEITFTIHSEDGTPVRRLSSSSLTRPSDDHALRLYWDGRDAKGSVVPEGMYTLTAETLSGFRLIKAEKTLLVTAGE